MILPAIVFGLLASTLYGALMHLWKDGGIGRLLLYLILSWVGFISGHFLAVKINFTMLDIGTLHFGLATVGSLAFLGVGHWLSLIQVEKTSPGR